MKKIIVVGLTASGKSTLSRRIASQLGYKYIELDALFWKPNWGEEPDDIFFQKISTAMEAKTWVLDGNYTRTRDLTWKEADTVIWTNISFLPNMWQSISRAVRRSLFQEELWEGTGNKESFSRLFSRDSIFLWFLNNYSKIKDKYSNPKLKEDYPHINFIELRSRREIDHFVKNLATSKE